MLKFLGKVTGLARDSCIHNHSRKTRYVLLGIIMSSFCASIMYFSGQMIPTKVDPVPPYHVNLIEQTFWGKTYPKGIGVVYFDRPEWVNGKEFEGCQYTCKIFSRSDQLSDAKVVIFHGPNLGKVHPPKKSPGQLWIMHGLESPVHYDNDLSQWNNMFNWTFTYRRDSDVLQSYGEFQQVPSKFTVQGAIAQFTKKDKMAAWMVSNCNTQSKRQHYKNKLQEVIDIHVYGGCGTYSCSRLNETICINILQKHYKFYLAFENSLCVDYVTEKAFKTYELSASTIPVMRGGSNYSLYFPPGSFLAANDFKNAYELGKTMKATNVENTKLENIFSWTKTRSINSGSIKQSWCSLCEHIHRSGKYKRLYSNIKLWLNDNPRSACKAPTDLSP